MAKHNAPTNKPCTFVDPLRRDLHCVRYDGHPANLYGRLGHRMRRARFAKPETVTYVCTRADLAGIPKAEQR